MMKLVIELNAAQVAQLARDTTLRNDVERSLNPKWKDLTPQEYARVFLTHGLDARAREHERQRRHAEVEASLKT